MSEASFTARYLSLDEGGQQRLLAQLSAELTVLARGAYEAGTEGVEQPVFLRRVNEMQHRVAFHLSHLLEGHAERYPDDVFADILVEHFRTLGVDADQFTTPWGRTTP